VSLGVEIQLERTVTDLAHEKATGRFDAVFVAVGAHLSRRQDIPAVDASRIFDAIQFLKQVESGNQPRIGRKVAVYGGGNTAMDAARSARRLGAEPLIIYRRTRREMPAHDFELEEALEEGVSVHWLGTIAGMSGFHHPGRDHAPGRAPPARASTFGSCLTMSSYWRTGVGPWIPTGRWCAAWRRTLTSTSRAVKR